MSTDHPALTRWRDSPGRHIAFLHGFGGSPDGYNLRPLEIALRSTQVTRLAGPVVQANDGRSWWDAPSSDSPSAAELSVVADTVSTQLGARPGTGAHDPLVLVGFSQGGAAALAMGLHAQRNLPGIAAIVCVAGFLPFEPSDAPDDPVPVLFVHPSDDEVVDAFLAQRSARMLTKAGYSASFTEIDGGHEWSDRVVGPIVDFLSPD